MFTNVNVSNVFYIYKKNKYEINTWGIIVNLDLKSLSPSVAMSMPSIQMLPPAASMIRNKESAIDDFPAPVLPTTPTCGRNIFHPNYEGCCLIFLAMPCKGRAL